MGAEAPSYNASSAVAGYAYFSSRMPDLSQPLVKASLVPDQLKVSNTSLFIQTCALPSWSIASAPKLRLRTDMKQRPLKTDLCY